MAAARKMLAADGAINRADLANEFNVPHGSVSRAVTILKYGTDDEIAKAESGERGIVPLYHTIAGRVPAGDRMRARTRATPSADTVKKRIDEAATWHELRQAVDLICGLPRPADVVAIAKAHRSRTATLDRKIVDAYSWLAEFSDAWTK